MSVLDIICPDAIITATVDTLNSTSQFAVCNIITHRRSPDGHSIGNDGNDTVEIDEPGFSIEKFVTKVKSCRKGGRISIKFGRHVPFIFANFMQTIHGKWYQHFTRAAR